MNNYDGKTFPGHPLNTDGKRPIFTRSCEMDNCGKDVS